MLIEITRKSERLRKIENGQDVYIIHIDGKQQMYLYDSYTNPSLSGSFSGINNLHHILGKIIEAADKHELIEIRFKELD